MIWYIEMHREGNSAAKYRVKIHTLHFGYVISLGSLM